MKLFTDRFNVSRAALRTQTIPGIRVVFLTAITSPFCFSELDPVEVSMT